MRETLNIDNKLMRKLSEEAERRGLTASELAEDGIKHILDGRCNPKKDKAPLPKWRSGGHLIDISNRDELYRIFDEDAGIRY